NNTNLQRSFLKHNFGINNHSMNSNTNIISVIIIINVIIP
ncbi:MAG: hypothetical protein ACI8P3_004564, partial [Saprospiraceae bacterium]